MSVTYTEIARLKEIFQQFNHTLRSELKEYRQLAENFKQQYQSNLSKLVQMYQGKIRSLELDKNKLAARNQLKKQKIILLNAQNQRLKQDNQQISRENDEKENQVKELAQQVSCIKAFMKEFRNRQPKKHPSPQQTSEQLPKQLSTIKEVNQELDLEKSLSLHSIASFEQMSQVKVTKGNIAQEFNFIDQQSHNNDYVVALNFFKSYNSEDDKCLTVVAMNDQNCQQEKRIGNATIKKIKKIRSIEVKSPSKSQLNQHFRIDQCANGDTLTPNLNRKTIANKQYMCFENQMSSCYQKINTINRAIQLIKVKPLSHPNSVSSIAYASGYIFSGNCSIDGVPFGFGKLLVNDQCVYQGQWKNGKFNGWGKLNLFPFSSPQEELLIVQIDGSFEQGYLQGTSLCIFNTGDRFMGMIRNGQIEGQGSFVSCNEVNVGHWQKSKLTALI